MEYGYIKTNTGLTVHFYDGESFTWTNDNPRYDDALAHVAAELDADDLRNMMDIKQSLVTAFYDSADVKVTDDGLFYNGKVVELSITRRIMDVLRERGNAEPLIKFLRRLLKNPRREAVLELYDFMSASELPVTPDGYFLAYKIVGQDYKDIYTGTFDNSIGAKPVIEPWEVDADRSRTCSAGLHACSKEYLPHYGSSRGSRIMIVKIDPANVVAVPEDYACAKLRCWTYEVVGEMNSRDAAGILEKQNVFHSEAVSDEHSGMFTWGDQSSDPYADVDHEVGVLLTEHTFSTDNGYFAVIGSTYAQLTSYAALIAAMEEGLDTYYIDDEGNKFELYDDRY